MILLEFGNRVLEEAIKVLSEGGRALKVECADFDGCSFQLQTTADKANVTVSLRWRCWPDLKANGAVEFLNNYYSDMKSSPESGFDYTISLPVANCNAANATKVSMLKTQAFAAPFEKIFAAVGSGGQAPPMTIINYRDGEAIYLKPEGDRVIVIFSISFKPVDDTDENGKVKLDEKGRPKQKASDDQVLAKVFLQEFVDARRKMNNAPSVSYAQKEAPLELKGVKGVIEGDCQGFVSFVFFKGHLSDKNRSKTIMSLMTFRNYLMYHIKCTKAYMHTRMRNRVFNLLQVLNRAKMERETEKKTATGRTFVRK